MEAMVSPEGTIGNGDSDLLARLNGLIGSAKQTREDKDGSTCDDGDGDEDADDHRNRRALLMRIATTAVCRLNTSAGGLGGSGTRGVREKRVPLDAARRYDSRQTKRGQTHWCGIACRRTGRVAGAMGTGVISHGLPFVSESRATPQEQRSRDHIYLTAHLFFAQTLLTQNALGLARGKALVDELEGKVAGTRYAFGDRTDMLCLRAFLPRHRLGQSADEDIGLMVLNDHAKGARHILNLGSREDLERHSDAPGAVRDRDTGACAANIERECNHLWTPRLRVQRIARGLESSSDARGILAAQPAPWWAYRHHGHRRAARSA